jgi:hypothetical protein
MILFYFFYTTLANIADCLSPAIYTFYTINSAGDGFSNYAMSYIENIAANINAITG